MKDITEISITEYPSSIENYYRTEYFTIPDSGVDSAVIKFLYVPTGVYPDGERRIVPFGATRNNLVIAQFTLANNVAADKLKKSIETRNADPVVLGVGVSLLNLFLNSPYGKLIVVDNKWGYKKTMQVLRSGEVYNPPQGVYGVFSELEIALQNNRLR